jgi:uncharacterized membrane protein YfcA
MSYDQRGWLGDDHGEEPWRTASAGRGPNRAGRSDAKAVRREHVSGRRWAEAIVLGLITNMLWAFILTVTHWLPHPLRFSHLRWLAPHQTLGSGLAYFATLSNPLKFFEYVGGLIVIVVAGEVLTEDISYYRMRSRQNRRSVRPMPGFTQYLLGCIFGRIFIGIVLVTLGETLLFVGGTIFNLIAGHPLLTAFHPSF